MDCVRRMLTSTEHRGLAPHTLLGPNRNFYLAIGRAKSRGSAKVAFSVANSEIRWAELVPSRTVLTLSVQNGPACSKSAHEKLGPIWPLGLIWLFSFYSVVSYQCNTYFVYYNRIPINHLQHPHLESINILPIRSRARLLFTISLKWRACS